LVGANVGTCVKFAVGAMLGRIVGLIEGLVVGAKDGTKLGWRDSIIEGLEVGTARAVVFEPGG